MSAIAPHISSASAVAGAEPHHPASSSSPAELAKDDEEYISSRPRPPPARPSAKKAKEVKAPPRNGKQRGKNGRFVKNAATKTKKTTKKKKKKKPLKPATLDEGSEYKDEDADELGDGTGLADTWISTGLAIEDGEDQGWKIDTPQAIARRSEKPKSIIKLTFKKKGKVSRDWEGIYEDTEDEYEGEDIQSGSEFVGEADTTDELQKDHSDVVESRRIEKAHFGGGKENNITGEEEQLSPLLYPRPKRFGLKDLEKNQPNSRAVNERTAETEELELPEHSLSSLQYLDSSPIRVAREQRSESPDLHPLPEGEERGRKRYRRGEEPQYQVFGGQPTEIELRDRYDSTGWWSSGNSVHGEVSDGEIESEVLSVQKNTTEIERTDSPSSEGWWTYASDDVTQSMLEKRRKRKFDALLSDTKQTEDSTADQAHPSNSTQDGYQSPRLPKNTVCISQFLKPHHLAAIMPSLEVLKKRRTSTGTSAATAVLVNGVRKVDKIKLAPHRSPVSHRKSLPQKDKDGEERNIDNIIFGDITFKAWYPSWYPKEIIGEKEGKDKEVVSELYVCKKCFGYGKDVMEWRKHVKVCSGGLEKEDLAREVYRYGGWEGDARWSVWEVDGAVETLFCQNLSLFAKLFLDNKSVFFDVSGFNYFLLVHTSPSSDPSSPPQRQIIGFFSKEKMSWDNNNLACILIFPPWQRKSLGSLLIGVSYAIARREGIMGGPEKPISELGMKGYKRYWGAEIARWILEYEIKPKSKDREDVNVEKISNDTWIAPDDCLAVLRDMGVVETIEEKGGKGLRKEGEGSGEKEKEKASHRVRIDKVAIREWVARNKLGLEWVVSEEGFAEGYALPEVEEEEEEVEEEDDGEEAE